MTFITHGFRVSVVSDVRERVRYLGSPLHFMLRRSSLVECVSVLHGTCLQCVDIFFIHQYVQPCLSKNPKYTFYIIKSPLTLAYKISMLHLLSSSKLLLLKVRVSVCHHLASVVNVLHSNLLFINHQANMNQTSQECFLGISYSKLYPTGGNPSKIVAAIKLTIIEQGKTVLFEARIDANCNCRAIIRNSLIF